MNIRNTEDEKCALWCILAHLFPKYKANRTNANGQQNHRSCDPNVYKEHEKDINTRGIEFPLRISAVGKLEKMNRVAINVFSIDDKANIIPIRISEEHAVSEERIIDLLYIVNGTQSHYCLITKLESLCRSQVTTDHTSSKYLCRRCLHFCSREESFKNHMERCSKHEPQSTLYPRKNDIKGKDKVRFTQISRQLPLPFYFVADFECILQKLDTCLPDPNKSSTTVVNKHVPCGVAYKISYRDPVIITQDIDGKSIAEQFLDSIQQDVRELREMLKYVTPMLPLTPEQLRDFESPDAICHICRKHIKPDDVKCKDHCHLSGVYHGPTHQSCNLNYQIKPDNIQIPCFFHNLKNYDAHILILAAKQRHGKITLIPTTTEKYISFTIGNIIFKDSFAFTQASLDSLAGNLTNAQLINTRRWLENRMVQNNNNNIKEANTSNNDGQSTSKRKYSDIDSDNDYDEYSDAASLPLSLTPSPESFISDESDNDNDHIEEDEEEKDEEVDEQIDYLIDYEGSMTQHDYRHAPHLQSILTDQEKQKVDEDLELLKSKGIYPYEYMDSVERFNEQKIPPIEAFVSSLKAGDGITTKEHAHAEKVFEHFEMKTLQDYHNLYLLQDILLLDDVLTAF